MITLENVVMRFGGLVAVDDVSFDIHAGRITGLIGPNGAGKTTLFNIMAGRLLPDLRPQSCSKARHHPLPPHERSHLGLARTFQIPQEFARLTVLENLMVAGDTRAGENVFNAVFRRRPVPAARNAPSMTRARETLDFLELDACREREGRQSVGRPEEAARTRPRPDARAAASCCSTRSAPASTARCSARSPRRSSGSMRERGFTFCLIEHDLDYVSRSVQRCHRHGAGPRPDARHRR